MKRDHLLGWPGVLDLIEPEAQPSRRTPERVRAVPAFIADARTPDSDKPKFIATEFNGRGWQTFLSNECASLVLSFGGGHAGWQDDPRGAPTVVIGVDFAKANNIAAASPSGNRFALGARIRVGTKNGYLDATSPVFGKMGFVIEEDAIDCPGWPAVSLDGEPGRHLLNPADLEVIADPAPPSTSQSAQLKVGDKVRWIGCPDEGIGVILEESHHYPGEWLCDFPDYGSGIFRPYELQLVTDEKPAAPQPGVVPA